MGMIIPFHRISDSIEMIYLNNLLQCLTHSKYSIKIVTFLPLLFLILKNREWDVQEAGISKYVSVLLNYT